MHNDQIEYGNLKKKLYKLKQHNISKPFCTLKLQCVCGILRHSGHRCSFIYLFIFERGLQRKNSCKIWLQKEEDFFFLYSHSFKLAVSQSNSLIL